jgi:hypothetical protein
MIATHPDRSSICTQKLRFCHRFLPIEYTASSATMTDIVSCFGPLIAEKVTSATNWLLKTSPQSLTVAIFLEARNASNIVKQDLTNALAAWLPAENIR